MLKEESFKAGLSTSEVKKRLKEFGPNELHIKGKFLFGVNLFSVLFALFLISVSLLLQVSGMTNDAPVIVLLVILNVIFVIASQSGFKKGTLRIKKNAGGVVTVIRDGLHSEISVQEIVPGDIIILSEGLVAPADIKIIEAAQLEIERIPVHENVESQKETQETSEEERNFIYAGVLIKKGNGKGLVVATGANTRNAKAAFEEHYSTEQMNLFRKKLIAHGKRHAATVLIIIALILLVGYLRDENSSNKFIAITFILASMPATPLILMSFISKCVVPILKQSWMATGLAVTEKLGSVSFICTEKTGVLTKNRIAVEEVYVDGKTFIKPGNRGKELYDGDVLTNPLFLLMTACALSNDAHKDDAGVVTGELIDLALYNFARNSGFYKESLEKTFPRIAEFPFDSERKCSTTLHGAPYKDKGCEFISFSKGDVEVLLGKSEYSLLTGGLKKLDRTELLKINARIAKMSSKVIAVATRCWPGHPGSITDIVAESNLTFIGLLGMFDPLREEARELVKLCDEMGVALVIFTGEHPATARALAAKMGIPDSSTGVLTGRELTELSDREFNKRAEKTRIYSRLNQEQKLKVLKALHGTGRPVASMGTVVNETSALKATDVRFAIGNTEKNFSGPSRVFKIVEAIGESRFLYANLNNITKYLMTLGFAELFTILFAGISGLPLPFLPIHIVWFNFFIAGSLLLTFSAKSGTKVMYKNSSGFLDDFVFTKGFEFQVFFVGLLTGLITLSAQVWSINNEDWQTQAFVTFCLMQVWYVVALITETNAIFRNSSFYNILPAAIIFLVLAVQVMVLYVPFFQTMLMVKPLSAGEFSFCLLISLILPAVIKSKKLFYLK